MDFKSMKLQVSSPIIIIFLKKYANIMTITWYKRCLCITEMTGIGVGGIAIIGIGIELP